MQASNCILFVGLTKKFYGCIRKPSIASDNALANQFDAPDVSSDDASHSRARVRAKSEEEKEKARVSALPEKDWVYSWQASRMKNMRKYS